MFILYAIVLGLVAGRLLGGRLENLGGLSFRWVGVAIAGLAAQVILFSPPASDGLRELGPVIYVASTAAVLTFVVANLRTAGMPVVALGAALNLLAILANGGTMPASPAALEAAGLVTSGGYTNSEALASPVLAPLGDVFAIPAGVPLANVFSIGDAAIALGVLLVVTAAMRRPLPDMPAAAPIPAVPAAEPIAAARSNSTPMPVAPANPTAVTASPAAPPAGTAPDEGTGTSD